MPRRDRKNGGGGRPAGDESHLVEKMLRENPYGLERRDLIACLGLSGKQKSATKIDCLLISLENRGVKIADDGYGSFYIVEEREKYLRGLRGEHQGREPGVRWGKLMGFNTGSS